MNRVLGKRFSFVFTAAVLFITQLYAKGQFANYSKLLNDSVSGNTILVWVDLDLETGNAVLKGSILQSAETMWPAGTLISDRSCSVCSQPEIRLNGAGNVVVTWIATNFSLNVNTANVATLPLAGTKKNVWSAPLQISINSEDVLSYQQVVINNKGNIWISWTSTLNENENEANAIQVVQGTFNASGGTWSKPQAVSFFKRSR